MNDHSNNTRSPQFEPSPTVFARGGAVYTNSQHVAAHFEKRHADVLRDIDVLVGHNADLRHVYFQEVSEEHPTVAGRRVRSFDLTKDGFTLLVMGYTGPKALPFKLSYIAKFNEMEAELRARPAPVIDFSDPKVLLGAFQHLQGQVAEKDAVIADLTPKAEAHDRIADSFGSVCRRLAAKNLGIPPLTLNRWMRTSHWTYQIIGCKDDLAYQSKISAGFLEHKVETGDKADGTTWTRTSVRVTPKGMLALAKAFPPAAREVP